MLNINDFEEQSTVLIIAQNFTLCSVHCGILISENYIRCAVDAFNGISQYR